MHANGEKPLPIASDGETELKSLVAGGASVLAANAQNWSRSVAELHDHFVLGWGSPIDATVVMFERSVDLPIAAETLILALAGSARLLVGDEVTVLEEGYGVVTSGGTQAKAAGKDPKDALGAAGHKPDLTKRGSLRTMFDGRYKFTRYFAPTCLAVPTFRCPPTEAHCSTLESHCATERSDCLRVPGSPPPVGGERI